MWFFKNKWKTKVKDQVNLILAQDVKIELGDLVAIVRTNAAYKFPSQPSTQEVILEMMIYIQQGYIKGSFILYDAVGNIIKETSSIFKEVDGLTGDWRLVYSRVSK
jgi:hypothetical protein